MRWALGAASGTEGEPYITLHYTCATCHGRGGVPIGAVLQGIDLERPCDKCAGTGMIDRLVTLETLRELLLEKGSMA